MTQRRGQFFVTQRGQSRMAFDSLSRLAPSGGMAMTLRRLVYRWVFTLVAIGGDG